MVSVILNLPNGPSDMVLAWHQNHVRAGSRQGVRRVFIHRVAFAVWQGDRDAGSGLDISTDDRDRHFLAGAGIELVIIVRPFAGNETLRGDGYVAARHTQYGRTGFVAHCTSTRLGRRECYR